MPLLRHGARSSRSESRTLPICRTASAAYPAGSRRTRPGPGVLRPGLTAVPSPAAVPSRSPGSAAVPASAAVPSQPQTSPLSARLHVTQLIFYKNDRLNIFSPCGSLSSSKPAVTSTSSGCAAHCVPKALQSPRPDRHEKRRTRHDPDPSGHEAGHPQDHRPHRRRDHRSQPRSHPRSRYRRRGPRGAERAQGARLPRRPPGRRGPAAVRRLLRPADLRAPHRARRRRRAERPAGRQRGQPGQLLAHGRDLRAEPAAGQHPAQHHRPAVRRRDPDRQHRRGLPGPARTAARLRGHAAGGAHQRLRLRGAAGEPQRDPSGSAARSSSPPSTRPPTPWSGCTR